MRQRSRVAVARCRSYDGDAVRLALGRAVALLGGMGRFVVPGRAVLLKPNILAPHPPEKAVTTLPAVSPGTHTYAAVYSGEAY